MSTRIQDLYNDETKRYDAPGPLSDDGSFVHYWTSSGMVVRSDNAGVDEYVISSLTQPVVR